MTPANTKYCGVSHQTWKFCGQFVPGSSAQDLLSTQIRRVDLKGKFVLCVIITLNPRGYYLYHRVCLFVCFWRNSPPVGHGLLIHEVSRSHTTTHHSRQDSSGRVISPSQRPLPDNTQHSQQTDIPTPGGIRTHNISSVPVLSDVVCIFLSPIVVLT